MTKNLKEKIIDEMVVPDHYRVVALWCWESVRDTEEIEYGWGNPDWSGLLAKHYANERYGGNWEHKLTLPTWPFPVALALFPNRKTARGGGPSHRFPTVEEAIKAMPPQSRLLARWDLEEMKRQ